MVGRLLDLGDPGDVDPRPRLDRGERLGRDEAAARLRPGDGELDPEHRARSAPRRTRSRPSRAACSGGSSGAAPRWTRGGRRGSARDVVAALQAVPGDRRRRPPRRALARPREVGAATDDRQHAAAVRPVPAAGPADACRRGTRAPPRAAASSSPSIGWPRFGVLGIALGGQDDPHRRAGQHRERRSVVGQRRRHGLQAALGRREKHRPERHRRAGAG